MTPVAGPVHEVPAEEVVEEEAGPEPGTGREERTLAELEKAVAEEAAGGEPALDSIQAAMLGEALAPERPVETPSKNAAEEPKARAERGKPRLVVYNFESSLETHSEIGDPLGGKVAAVLTGHAARSGFFQTFSELEQEEIIAAHPFAARGDTDPAKIAFHAREYFKADLAIWGRVTGSRSSPTIEFLALDLRRKGTADFGPRLGRRDNALALRESHDCPNLHSIPVVADRILEALAGRPLGLAAARVVRRAGPNLIRNGSFRRKGRGGSVPGWESPLPEGASVEKGRLMLRLTAAVATTHGLGVYSDWLRVDPGAHYELSCRSRAKGVTIIVWARGYAEFKAHTPGEREVDPRREAFRHQFRPASQVEPDEKGWMAVTSKPFRPRHFRHEIKWMRVRLYAFGGGAGTAEFDDVVLRKVELEGDVERAKRDEDERMLKSFGEKAGGGGE